MSSNKNLRAIETNKEPIGPERKGISSASGCVAFALLRH